MDGDGNGGRYTVQDFLALNNDFCFHTLDATLVNI